MRESTFEMNGTVVGVNRGAVAVELTNGTVIRGIVAGRLVQHRIRVMVGDKVAVEVTPYDPTKGRIIWRDK